MSLVRRLEDFSALAIAAFVLACISPFAGPAAFVPAIICGHLALVEQRREPDLQGYRFASAGLTIGYIVGLLYLTMVVWLFSGFSKVAVNALNGAMSSSLPQQPLSFTQWLGSHPTAQLVGLVAIFFVVLLASRRIGDALGRAPPD